LLDAVADWARDRGCDRLVLSVTESNETARRFYEASGFVDTGDRMPLREGSRVLTLRLSKHL
ncbi:MAG: GNAT family N-acetyltransferase, partial [Actinomycetota bacterium]|nr:GNAT family N-acetyltransferase [Actinomycetota bacterium]